MSRVEPPENETELRIFHNRLRILTSIDKHELVEAGVLADDDTLRWKEFQKDPYRVFVRCNDETCTKLFGIIQRRENFK